MRLLFSIGLMAGLSCAAGCRNFKWGGDWASTGSDPNASGVNVYNCSDDQQIEVFRRVAGNGNQWTYISATGSTSDESTCPDEGDIPIYVELPAAEKYQIRLNYYSVNSTCEGNDPEGDCSFQDKSYDGQPDGPVVDRIFPN